MFCQHSISIILYPSFIKIQIKSTDHFDNLSIFLKLESFQREMSHQHAENCQQKTSYSILRVVDNYNIILWLAGSGRVVWCLRVLRVQRAARVRSRQLCLQVGGCNQQQSSGCADTCCLIQSYWLNVVRELQLIQSVFNGMPCARRKCVNVESNVFNFA